MNRRYDGVRFSRQEADPRLFARSRQASKPVALPRRSMAALLVAGVAALIAIVAGAWQLQVTYR
jgi:hypothetical protein